MEKPSSKFWLKGERNMKLTKKLLAFLLACLCVFSLFACGGTEEDASENQENVNANDEDYQKAINDLRTLLDTTYSEEELNNPEIYFDYYRYSEDSIYPLIYHQEALADLYQRFVSFGNYKQAKEIADRFTVLEKGKVAVNQTVKNEDNTESTRKNVANFILDSQGRKVWQGYDYLYLGGTFYLYDEDGKLLRERNKIYEYDEKGVCTGFKEKDPDLSNYISSAYYYDEQGKCIKESHAYKTGVLITYTHTYDEQGRLIGTLDKYNYNRVSSKKEITYDYKYNDKGQLTVVQRHSKSYGGVYGDSQDFIEVYSEAGNLLYQYHEICRETDCSVDHLENCQYEDGLPVSVSFTDRYTFTFEYSTAYLFDEKDLNLSDN